MKSELYASNIGSYSPGRENCRNKYPRALQENGFQTYPGKFGLKNLKELKVPISLHSDCHHPKDIIWEYGNKAQLLMELGFKELMKLKANDWQSKPFDQNGFA